MTGQTTHVREMAANLLLGRALQALDAAGGLVVFWDAEGRWQKDAFTLPGRPDRLEELASVLEALLEWTLYTEKPAAIDNLQRSRWARHLLHGAEERRHKSEQLHWPVVTELGLLKTARRSSARCSASQPSCCCCCSPCRCCSACTRRRS